MKSVVVVSGGMDSTTLLHDVVAGAHGDFEEVRGLSVNYNQRHKRELQCAQWNCQQLGIRHIVVDLSDASQQLLQGSALTTKGIEVPEGHYESENAKVTVVPSRNMLLLALATSYLVSLLDEEGCGTVFYGAHKGDFDVYADCRPAFVEAMQKAVALCDFRKVSLEAPYVNMYKWDIAERAKQLDLLQKGSFDDVPMKHTHTCYKGAYPACGKCPTCQERVYSWHRCQVIDPLPYITGWDAAVKYALKVQEEYESKKSGKGVL